eukprot:g2663.t1
MAKKDKVSPKKKKPKKRRPNVSMSGEKSAHKRLKRVLLKYGIKKRSKALQKAYASDLGWLKPKLAAVSRLRDAERSAEWVKNEAAQGRVVKAADFVLSEEQKLEDEFADTSSSSSSCLSSGCESDGEFVWPDSDVDESDVENLPSANEINQLLKTKQKNENVGKASSELLVEGPCPRAGNLLDVWGPDDVRLDDPLCIATVLAEEESLRQRSERVVHLIELYKQHFRRLQGPMEQKVKKFREEFEKERAEKRKRKKMNSETAGDEADEEVDIAENSLDAANLGAGSGCGRVRKKRRHYTCLKHMHGGGKGRSRRNKYKHRYFHHAHGLRRRAREGLTFDEVKKCKESREKKFVCAFGDCNAQKLPLTKFCLRHILNDPDQRLYQKCSYEDCTEPVLRTSASDGSSELCATHLQQFRINGAHSYERYHQNQYEQIEYTQQQFTCPKCSQVSQCDLGVTQIPCGHCGQVLLLQIPTEAQT